ncbi:MAG: prepilin-type N-terminal cleavage/methylation domain-containing protein [Candidatus Competibacteraceae bacterium]|nr:prepilin-type N-terminal cleavage/methylation domain-containing protein [Candidatus Competibacteraceae bacterium]
MKQNGFTLLELIVTMAIAAIVLTVAVPSFQGIIRNNRIASHTNDFTSSLNLARSEAVKRARRVVLCKSTDSASCDTSSAGWEQGWIVFVDIDNDAAVDSDDEILRVYGAPEGVETITGNTNITNYISYTQQGFTRLTSGAFQAGTLTFSLCDSQNKKREIVINSMGRPKLNQPDC